MLPGKPSTIDFDSIIASNMNLEKTASGSIRKSSNTVVVDKVASEDNKLDLSNLEIDTGDSVVIRAGKRFGLSNFFTKK